MTRFFAVITAELEPVRASRWLLSFTATLPVCTRFDAGLTFIQPCRIEECYRLRVVERSWIVPLGFFMDIFSPEKEELDMLEMAYHVKELPTLHLLSELLCRIPVND